MSILARLFSQLNHSGIEKRRENLSVHEANERQTERVLRDELDAQYQIVIRSTDPLARSHALDEIERLETMLRPS